MIRVRNNNRRFAEEVFAADGDSVLLPAGSEHTLDDKFAWNPPASVVIIKSAVPVVAVTTTATTTAATTTKTSTKTTETKA